MTDFQKVCEFNKAFDFPVFSIGDFSQDAVNCYKLRIALINEEINELFEAFAQKDIIEQMDACGDILYVAYGMGYSYGYNFDELMIKNFDYKYILDYPLFTRLSYDQNRTSEQSIAALKKLQDELNESTNIETSINIALIIIYCVYEFQFNACFNSPYIFDVIHKSNMTKLCNTEEEAAQTVAMYKEKFANRFDSPYYYKLDSGKYVVKNRSTGKSLKSINYVKVEFDLSRARKIRFT